MQLHVQTAPGGIVLPQGAVPLRPGTVKGRSGTRYYGMRIVPSDSAGCERRRGGWRATDGSL
jgi:hypothetical protein